MKSKLSLSVVFILILTLFFACNNPKKNESKFVLSGTLEGISEGQVMLMFRSENGLKKDSALIKEGKFVMKGDYPVPTRANFNIRGTGLMYPIYLENTAMTLTLNVKEPQTLKIEGGKEQECYNKYSEGYNAILLKYKDVKIEYRKAGTSEQRKAEILQELKKQKVEKEAFMLKFIKENPAAYHSATLLQGQVKGMSAIEAEKILNGVDPQLQKNPLIVSLKAKLAKLKEVEVGIDEMMANVNNVPYKVDEKFDGKDLKDIIYLGLMSNNNVCALKKDGTVEMIDAKGKVLNTFKPEFNGRASSLAVDVNDDIYLLCSIMEKVTKKVRGRSVERMMAKSVECTVFNVKGEKKAQYACEGIITATGARVVDNNLVVADYRGAKLAMFDKTSGKVGPVMEGMRPCCGILDFSVNSKDEILVANLGAFRVQGFDFSGKNILAFGQRGKTLNDFHGCCNPVSVANLSTGAIVTVEKDPTRIKIYSKEGAKQIAGIEELVKGCSYIPMIVDRKDNLYLASGAKGMVKCVSF